jgi:hypothetical protein
MWKGKMFGLGPVRVYSIVSAALTFFISIGFTDLPVAAILGLVSAILGLSEVARAKVTPTVRANDQIADAYVQGGTDAIDQLRAVRAKRAEGQND